MGTQIRTNNNYRLQLPVAWNAALALASVDIYIAPYAGAGISGTTSTCDCDTGDFNSDFGFDFTN